MSAALATTLLSTQDASAQGIPLDAPRSSGWSTMSNITMLASVGIVTLMPRVYYNDPEATVGWKGRWHVSMLAPALSLTALTLLVDGPIKNAIKTPRPGCTIDDTGIAPGGYGCDSFAMPSTQSFAAFGSMGAGTAIFLVDTFKYSNSKFHAGSFVGNVAVPLVLSVLTAVGRSQPTGNGPTFAQEDVGSIVVGSLTGFATGALLGLGYSMLQRPNCGYGGHIICW